MKAIRNALTVDVEDYFQVSAFEQHIDRSDWDRLPSRVERNVHRILEMLAAAETHATFFTLGWIAEHHPQVVRAIVAQGHELASHGYGHWRANRQTRAQFRDDVTISKTLLEQLAGQAVQGYRAPSFSIGADNLWALETLREAGYRYSSSIYPIHHDHYGMPAAPRFAHRPQGAQGLLELPLSTVRLGARNWPAAGGGYFRLIPYAAAHWLLRRINEQERQPAIFYFHPWEIDPAQPRQHGLSWRTRLRHYLNLSRMEGRLVRLVRDFQWDRIDRIFLETPCHPAAST